MKHHSTTSKRIWASLDPGNLIRSISRIDLRTLSPALATTAACLSVSSLPLSAQTAGSLSYERWNILPSGNSVNVLKKHGISQRPADISQLVSGAATAQGSGDNYGARLRGTVTAPVTGNYTFFISSDDNGELWFSQTPSGMDKDRVAWHSGHTDVNQWSKYSSQRSRTYNLEAGRSYFLEALMKEGSGGDHLSIGWAYEAPVALSHTDIGSPVTAVWSESKGTYTTKVFSGDIWGSSDRCSTMLRQWSGDGEFIARIASMNNPEEWAKAGITIRGGLESDAQNVSMMRTGSNGMTFQRRKTTGGGSSSSKTGANYEWVKLVRKGDVITGYLSSDGKSWDAHGKDTLAGLPKEIQVGLAASNHGAGFPVFATFGDFSCSPLAATEVIPAASLTSFSPDPADADGDNLPDAWQTLFPITGTEYDKSEFADPDGDLITNLEESQLGSDPLTPSGKPGYWLAEKWNSIPEYDVEDLIREPRFFSKADDTRLVSGWSFDVSPNQGARRRAYLTAPDTGEYVFWISARGAAQLLISSDDSKYAKRMISNMGVQAGTGYGIRSDSSNLWDNHFSQMSAPISLVAGKRYFIEYLTQNGHPGGGLHASIAWPPRWRAGAS